MTALNPEAKQPEPQAQAKVDTNTPQPNVDTNLTQQKTQIPEQSKQESKEPETAEDPNWKAFREARKKDRAEKEAAERKAAEKEHEVAALKAAMDAAFSAKSSPSPQAYQQYYGMGQGNDQPEENEDQKIDRKVNEIIAKKEEQYRRQQQEEEQREFPKRLMKDMPDFTQVCSQENLDYFEFHFPEIASLAADIPDGYDKWKKTYQAIKKFIPNHSNAKKEAARADLNSNKPRSMSATSSSPTGEPAREAFQDTEARRAANWARMQRTMKGV